MKIVSIFCYREQIPHEMCPEGGGISPWEQNPAILCPSGCKFSPWEQKRTEMCPGGNFLFSAAQVQQFLLPL